MVVDNTSSVNIWKFTDFTFHDLSLQNIFTFVSDSIKDRFDKTVVPAIAVNFSSLSVAILIFFFLQKNSLVFWRIEIRIEYEGVDTGMKRHRTKRRTVIACRVDEGGIAIAPSIRPGKNAGNVE